MLRTSMRLNGFTELAITKLDVLSGLDKVRACESYNIGDNASGKKIAFFPYSNKGLEKAKPNYAEFNGFTISGNEKKYSDLSADARKYLEFIEKEMKCPIRLISVGPERGQTILK
ncbi:Adenylosuccinate synthetase [uncultured archaeon]|nr:Adenylosuccinate synthetase [uncultured archaeon]